MDSVHKIQLNLRDLPTSAVTLFPASAQVKRDVKGVNLKVSHSSLPNN